MGPCRAWHRRWVPAAPAALRAGSGPSSVTGGSHRGSRAAAGGGRRKSGGDTRGCAPLPGAPQALPAGEPPRGDRGLPRGGTAGAERTEAPRPPQPARLVRPHPGAGPGDVRLLGEEKKKKITHTHMHKKCVFCVRGLGGVTVSVRGRKGRRAEGRVGAPPATLPHPRSSAPAPTEPLQGSAGPGGGGRGLPLPGGGRCRDRSSRGDRAESGPLGAAHGEEPAVIYGGEQRSYVFSVIQLLFN